MKGIISGIKRMEIHDGDGLRTTVFFKGCPLKCIWCHNPESISFEKQVAFFDDKCIGCNTCKGEKDLHSALSCPANAKTVFGEEYEAPELARIILKDKPFFDNSNGGVTLSGGECLAQPAFATELSRILKSHGISVFIDTCGYVKRQVLEDIIPYTDKFLYDVKAIDPEIHAKCTSRDNGIILDNLDYLTKMNCDIEVRYPLVTGCNDTECNKIGELLSRLGIKKIKVLQYHPFAASRYTALGMENTLPKTETTPNDVETAVSILRSYGLSAINGITEA